VASEIRVAGGIAYNSSIVQILWTGSEYALTWTDDRDGNNEIYFARLSANGTKIGSDVRITSADYGSSGPSIAWTGSQYGLAWGDARDDGSVPETYFCRVSSAGNKVGSDLRMTNDIHNSAHESLTWSGSEFGLAWMDSLNAPTYRWDIFFQRLSNAGSVIGSPQPLTANTVFDYFPSVAWNGSEYGVSWRSDRDGNEEIYFQRIASNGTGVGSNVRITTDPFTSDYPSMVWADSVYGLSWNDDRTGNNEIYFSLLWPTGSKIGGDVRVTSAATDSLFPSLVWTGSLYGLVWQDSRDGNSEIYFTRISENGLKFGADYRVTLELNESAFPSLAWSGSEFGIAWEDDRDGNLAIYFARVGPIAH
jgi:hypothetical protein